MKNDPQRQQRAFNELAVAMQTKEKYLQQAMNLLGEHFNGVVILVHCFDPETQASISRSVTSGDPLATRQLGLKFVQEQQWLEELQFRMRFGPSNENPPNFPKPS